MNYGIGGHYHPHIDIMGDEGYGHYGDSGNNPRLATFLFYLTDVEKGGGTAFINANVLVQPRKGSGVFWWNLDQYGERDEKPRDQRTTFISLSDKFETSSSFIPLTVRALRMSCFVWIQMDY